MNVTLGVAEHMIAEADVGASLDELATKYPGPIPR
jgi:hypothetical protein